MGTQPTRWVGAQPRLDSSGCAYRWSGTAMQWDMIPTLGTQFAWITAQGYRLLGISADRMTVSEISLDGVAQVAGPADRVYVNDFYVFGVSSGTVLRRQRRPPGSYPLPVP
jgi:hypothetical protein